MDWYYQNNDSVQGPIPEETFHSLIADGTIHPNTPVWHDGMSEWQPLAVAAPAAFTAGGGGSRPLVPSIYVPTGNPATNAELKARARSGPKENWWTLGGGLLIWTVLDTLAGGVFPVVGSFIVVWCLEDYSVANMGLRGADHRKLKIGDAFISFTQFGRAFACCFLTTLYTMLWGLLLIVPGIVKCFSYMLAPELAIEHPDWSVTEAITESQRLMDGNKWRAFELLCSFAGWWLLALLGIVLGCVGLWPLWGGAVFFLLFWLLPYMVVTYGAFYRAVVHEKGSRTSAEAS